MRMNKLAASVAGSLALLGTLPAAQAIDIQAGDWTFSASGEINANYVYTSCDNRQPALSFGGALAGSVVGACDINTPTGENDFSQIRTGLLPGQLVLSASTTQNGWDISGTFGLYPGIVTNEDLGNLGIATGGTSNLTPGGNVGLGTTQLDVRQVFLQFGNSEFGTVKAGRDFGLFGFDAIINDMTIPAVGASPLAVGSPGNTSLGSIGFGYIYADTLTQINYTTPDYNGVTMTVGIMEPIDSLTAGLANGAAGDTLGVGENIPGFQGQLKYSFDGGFLSTDVVTFTVDGVRNNHATPDDTDDDSFREKRVTGVDANYKQKFGPIDVLLSAYYTDGLGSVAYLFDSFDALGSKRDSYGGLAQVTYEVGRNKFGVNYGESRLRQTDYDDDNVPNLFRINRKVTAGYYFSLTPNLTLTAEYTHSQSVNHADDDIDADNWNVGAFFSF